MPQDPTPADPETTRGYEPPVADELDRDDSVEAAPLVATGPG